MVDATVPAPSVGVDPSARIDRLDLGEGSWVDVSRGWIAGADELYDAMLGGVAWQATRLFRYDHWVEERRLSAFWKRGMPLPHPALADVVRSLQRRYRVTFDGFGMLHYRDGSDGQAFHRDTDMRWLDDTVVAIVTLGAQRSWQLRPRAARHHAGPGRGAAHDLTPAGGDLIVMGGRCQAAWEHSVPYLRTGVSGPRISLQFRHARRTGRPFMGAGYRAPLTYRGR